MLDTDLADQGKDTRSIDSHPSSGPQNLAILIFDGVQIIDYTGPYETFGHVYNDGKPQFNIYTVSKKSEPITTTMGMRVIPKYSFDNAPKPDVLLVPGGHVDPQLEDHDVIDWVRAKAGSATVTMSVCNGAFILAKAGLLDGLEVTTTFGLIDKLRHVAPKAKVVDDKRYVDSGNIVTAAGLSSGIDCSLHLIERFFGKGTAQMAALGMEYNWDPQSRFVRAALADKYMQFDYDVKSVEGGWKPLSREGTRDQWKNQWEVRTDTSAAEILESVNKTIANANENRSSGVRWVQLDVESSNDPGRSVWQFADEHGDVWKGIVIVEPEPGKTNQFILTVKVERKNSAIGMRQ